MEYVESVEAYSDRKSHWKLKGPVGLSAEWDAEITDEHEGKQIAWQTTGDTDVPHSGRVRFDSSNDSGTVVRVRIDYESPKGVLKKAAQAVSTLWSESQLRADLERFKQLMEKE